MRQDSISAPHIEGQDIQMPVRSYGGQGCKRIREHPRQGTVDSTAGHAGINARGESCQHLPEGKASSLVESRTACGKGGRILMPQGTPRFH